VGWSFVSDFASKLSVLIINLAAIRLMPPHEYGRFATFQAAGLLGVSVWDLGVSPLVTRAVAAGRISGSRTLVEVCRLRALTLAPAIVVVAVGVATAGSSGVWSWAAAVAAAYMVSFGSQLVLQSALRGHFRFRDAAISTALGRVALLGSFVVALCLAPSSARVYFVLLSLAIGEAVTAGAALWQLRALGGSEPELTSGRVLTFRRAAPFAATSLIQVSYNRMDVVFVAAISSTLTVGLYGPASRIQDMMYLIPNMAALVLLPYASRLYAAGPSGAKQTRFIWIRLTTFSVVLSMALAAVASGFAPVLIPLVFGEEYVGSVGPVQIIVWSVPLIAFNTALAAVVGGRHKPQYVTFGILVALVTVITTDLLLVPRWGAAGAAVGATIREVPLAIILILGASASGLFGRIRGSEIGQQT
jgi:O-antigen/teichoic acid export membrane protein